MSELKYVIKGFDAHFHEFENSRIIIHGTRAYAESIIREFGNKYNFIAAMTNDDVSYNTFCGLPVINENELLEFGADVVILTERVKYEHAAYISIREKCQMSGIKVFDMYGLEPKNILDDYQHNKSRKISDDKKIIDNHDVVIFEVMDTFMNFSGNVPVILRRAKELYRYARESNKHILFSLRKSFSRELQIEVLLKNGFISCKNDSSLIERQGEDLSLRKIAENCCGQKIVYYGTGLINEFWLPRYYGIDSYYMANGLPFIDSLNDIISIYGNDTERICSNFNEAIALIESHDVISFDIFDTLIMRKVLEPGDVISIMCQKLSVSGFTNADHFYSVRMDALHECPNADIYKIYEIVAGKMGLTTEEKVQLLELELSVEREIIVKREKVVELFNMAVSKGKTVVLTSDMYFPEKILGSILHGVGISGWDALFVSCEHHLSKQQGLFAKLNSKYPSQKILHLGNDIYADLLPAERNGIRTILIPSGVSLAVEGGWGAIISGADKQEERNLLGLIISKIFNDPFLPVKYSELGRKNRMIRFAVGACLPIILGYLFWLVKRINSADFFRMLFVSRDGYIMPDIYNAIRRQSNLKLPEATYFYSNRHSSFLLCADDPVFETMIHDSIIDIPEKDRFTNIFGFIPQDDTDDISEMIRLNKDRIKKIVLTQRKNFIKYLMKTGIDPLQKNAFMDFVSSGKTLDFLRAGGGMNLCAFFVGRPNYLYTERKDISFYVDTTDDNFFIDYYNEMEYILISPESSLDHFNDQGCPVFSGEVRTEEEIRDILFIQDEIKKAAKDYIDQFYHDDISITPDFAVQLYAADGLHGIMKEAYDDWAKSKLI